MKKNMNKMPALAVKAMAALNDAAEKVVAEAKAGKKSLIIWKNGRVTQIAASRLRLKSRT